MKQIKKIIILTLIVILLINISIISITYGAEQTINSEINSMDTNKYPGIKEKIEQLQSKYPNWKFKLLYTGLDWNDVIENEYKGHGASPKNLVYKGTNYQGEWICSICGDKSYDNGNWRCTSEQAIKYMMDPRNSLNESDIFQFEELTNTEGNIEILKTMTKDSFLTGHEQGILDAANNNNVNPYYIVARLIQEQGKQGTVLVTGNGYNNQYKGYYNAFNIAASGNSTSEILTNALAYAQKKEWTTLDKSIDGGISFLAKQYIQKGQNTLYLQKFDVEATNGLYSNQYMQNILAAQNEGTTLRNTYTNINSLSSSHTFIIPIYENMPKEACKRPDTNKINTTDEDVVKVNVETSLRIRNNPNGDTTVGYLYKDEIVIRLEKAESKVNGTYWDKIKKSDGTIGYVARETYENEANYKLYLIPLNENKPPEGNNQEKPNTENNNNPSPDTEINIKDTNTVKLDKESKSITVKPNATASDILEACGGSAKITRADGSFLSGADETVGTGYIIEDKYVVVKKGDCNGDGKTNSLDAAIILRYTVGQYDLKDAYFKAGAISENQKVTSLDAAKILRFAVGQFNLEI